MYIEFEDELFNSHANKGLEKDSEDSRDLFGYEQTNDVEVEKDLDSDLENDLMDACLVDAAFSLSKTENSGY